MTILVLHVDFWDSSLRVGMTGSFFFGGGEVDLGGKAAQISLSLVRICKPCLYIVARIATNSQQPKGDKSALAAAVYCERLSYSLVRKTHSMSRHSVPILLSV